MATKATNKLPARQGSANSSSESSYYIPPPPVLVDNNRQETSMGFLVCLISMVLVFVLMLPVMGFMLFDVKSARQECRYERQKMEQLVRQIEKEKEK
jgi:hypothetical protein